MSYPTSKSSPMIALTILSGLLAAAPASATDCTVKPWDAYQAAVKRGWQFACFGSSLVSQPAFIPLPSGELSCIGKTGPAPVPHWVDGQFFEKSGYKNKKFANGWSLKQFEVVGGQHSQLFNAASVVYFRGNVSGAFKSYNFRVSKMVLTKSGGSCAKVLDEAF